MKYLLLLIALYQTIATLVELPGGWIMYTKVDSYEWSLKKNSEEVEWRSYVPPNNYFLNLNLIEKLAEFVCEKNNFKDIELHYRRSEESEWSMKIVSCIE